MDRPLPLRPEALHETRRRKRQARLYVLLQTIGWLGFLTINVFFSHFFNPESKGLPNLDLVLSSTRIVLIGWLLTHFSRGYMRRRRWHELGVVALVPRVIVMSGALSLLWIAVGYTYHFVLLDGPWPSQYPPIVLALLSYINGAILMLGWFCLYFSYHVFDRFNSSEIERLRLESSVKEAELRALKAQVNPHFMFNALNSVRALIDEDPARARRAVTQLANLLRYSLQSGTLETVSFDDELQVVNDYLALEQVRHEERLRLRVDVEPAALALPVPPMLLQTLVENAVKYGISQRAEGGEVGVMARCIDGELEIRVSNPGNLPTSSTVARATESTGLGLHNAAERLRLLFGERASLRLREEQPGLVVAVARLPRATASRGVSAIDEQEPEHKPATRRSRRREVRP